MDKTYARFILTVSASVEDINALSESVERLTQALVDDVSDKCTAYTGSTIRVKFNELKEYDYSQSAEHVNAPDGGDGSQNLYKVMDCGHSSEYIVYSESRNYCGICGQDAHLRGVIFSPSRRR